MTQAVHTQRDVRISTLRRVIVVLAILAVLLTTQMSALASEAAPAAEDQQLSVLVLQPAPEPSMDLTSGLDDGATAAKGPVSVWGKCQVPGKCEIGISIKIRF